MTDVQQKPRQRIPPQNLDAERSLLGAMLLSRDAIAAGEETVTPADFYKPAHAHIYTTILTLAGRGEPSDPVTVADELSRNGLLDLVGGIPALANLQAATPSTTNAARYARIIEEHALLRRLIAVAGEIAELGYSTPDDITVTVDHAEQLVYSLAHRTSTAPGSLTVGTALTAWLDALERRFTHGTQAVPTGLADLDDKLAGGLHPEQFVTIAGRPGTGKTLLGVQVAYHIAETGIPALVVSAEMPTDELVGRIVASQAKVDNQRLRTGRLHESDWPKISGIVTQIGATPLYIYDAPGATLASIRAQIRRVRTAAGSLGVVVVDYLQLLTSTAKTENRQVEVAEMSRGLKLIARELKVPVVGLCQINRNVEARADKRPLLADLRESGAIEADSDVVVGVYRDDMYSPDSADRGTAELIVLKHRGGPLGTVKVAYLSSWGVFADMART